MKRKKIDPEHFLTDALITNTDEMFWARFDDNLRLEIQELEKVDYDNTPIKWKKNTLAFSYLHHVRKLLTEKGISQATESIGELENLIEKYLHLKTFLLSLRLATIAYRSGVIPDVVKAAAAHSEEQSRKGQKSRTRDGITPSERLKRNQTIIEHFNKTRLTPAGFAQKHALKYELKPRQIRNILQMAVGN